MRQPRITLVPILAAVGIVGFAFLFAWSGGPEGDAGAGNGETQVEQSLDDRQRLKSQITQLRREIDTLEERVWDAIDTSISAADARRVMTGLLSSTIDDDDDRVTAADLISQIEEGARSKASGRKSSARRGLRELHDEWVLLNLRREDLEIALKRLTPPRGARRGSVRANVSSRALTHQVVDGLIEVTVEVDNRSDRDQAVTLEIGGRLCNPAQAGPGQTYTDSGSLLFGSELLFLTGNQQQVTTFVYPLPTDPEVENPRFCSVHAAVTETEEDA